MLYGVLLAGGSSERFGEDKYLWRVEGRPLISIAASAVRDISDKVYLLVRDRERGSQLLKELSPHIDGFIIDDFSINCGGPLRGILTALFHAEADEYLVVPGDMPWIDRESLGRFIDLCRSLNVDCGSVIWGNGALSPTIQYLTKNARRRLDVVAKLRGIYGRATDTLRSCNRILLAHVKNVVNDPKNFIGVNFREELVNPQVPPIDGVVKDNVRIEHPNPYFIDAITAENSQKIDEALRIYRFEAEEYLSLKINHLALHAFIDVKRCLNREDAEVDSSIQKCVNELRWNKVKRYIPR